MRDSEASPSSARARASREGGVVENAVVGARTTVGEGTIVVGSVIGDDAELGIGCALHNLAVVGPGAKLGDGNVLDHGLRVGAGPDDPRRRRCASREPLRSTTPRKVDKPWGWELVWAEAEDYVGKLLFVRAGESLSLQYHEVKDESWLVQEGRARLELGEVDGELETVEIAKGDAFRFRPRHGAPRHRCRGHARRRGLDEPPDDVVRLEDRYGREGTSAP